MGGQKDDDERRPEVWAYEGPTADGSPRFKVGDRVEVSDVGGPYVVMEDAVRAQGGGWLYACTVPSDDPSAPALREWVLKQRAAGAEHEHDLPVSWIPQTHLRFCRRPS